MNEEARLIDRRFFTTNKLGQGSYSVVYKAEDTHNDNVLVAVKIVSSTYD